MRLGTLKRAGIVLLVWGLWIGIATAPQAIFGPRQQQFEMCSIASTACLLCGLGLWALDARHVAQDAPRLLADSSFATATLICGLAVALLGAGYGYWLCLIGAGLTALGAGGLVREALARRGAAALARRLDRRDDGTRPDGTDTQARAGKQPQERVA